MGKLLSSQLSIAAVAWLLSSVSVMAIAEQADTTQANAPAPTSGVSPVEGVPVEVAPAEDTRRLSELFYQLQVLQQEVQELRGLNEEQAYQLNRLARDQQQQYLDLDRRVAGLTRGGTAAPGATAADDIAANGIAGHGGLPEGGGQSLGVANSATSAVPSSGGVSERNAYTRAFDLMKGRQFDESIASFNGMIMDYPNGQYTPNAFYWLGELHLAQQNTEQARQSFMQVVNLYPDHPKVPDTLYKLGVAYHRLGDNTRAMSFFDRVRSEYSQSSAAGLAASYAAEMQ
jgi:tol-pal system protein YbgF